MIGIGKLKGVFWKRGLFSPFPEVVENSEALEIPIECGKQRTIQPRSRESGDFGDSSSEKKTPFVMILVTRIAATSNRKSLATAFATQKNHCDSEDTSNTAISLRFLREKLATSNCDWQSLAICDCDGVGH